MLFNSLSFSLYLSVSFLLCDAVNICCSALYVIISGSFEIHFFFCYHSYIPSWQREWYWYWYVFIFTSCHIHNHFKNRIDFNFQFTVWMISISIYQYRAFKCCVSYAIATRLKSILHSTEWFMQQSIILCCCVIQDRFIERQRSMFDCKPEKSKPKQIVGWHIHSIGQLRWSVKFRRDLLCKLAECFCFLFLFVSCQTNTKNKQYFNWSYWK